MPAQHLAGRVALVTGGGRGLGRAHALRLARHGAAIVVNDAGAGLDGAADGMSPAADVVEEICARGGQAIADDTDVSSFEGGRAVVDASLGAFDRLDIVVNNAGIAVDAPIEDLTEELLQRLLAVHYLGTLGVCHAVIPHMRCRGYGRIVNTVSEVAFDNRMGGGIAYGGAKAAVWGATLALARQVDGQGITVNALSPGARTRMNDTLFAARPPLRPLDPDAVARIVAALVGEDAGHLNGVVIHTAGGAVREYLVQRRSGTPAVEWLDGKAGALDEVAEQAPPSRRPEG